MDTDSVPQTKFKLYARFVTRIVLFMLIFFGLIFLAAGRLDFWQGWVYFGYSLALTVVILFFYSTKGDLLQERMKPGPGAKWWDKIFYAIYLPLIVVLIVVACLDVGRYHWSPVLPVWVYVTGYVFYTITFSISIWAMHSNKFFSSTVRIQTDRGHTVVRHGPYRYVRHPGYVGAIGMMYCISMVLGSLWGFIPAFLITLLLIIRTFLEDTTLQNELAGYKDYSQSVRYRLFPGIW